MTIEDLVVDQAYRRQHIGQNLVRAAEIIGRTRDCHAIELSSDFEREESYRFWQALGYKRLAHQFGRYLRVTEVASESIAHPGEGLRERLRAGTGNELAKSQSAREGIE